jgi:hypothetical protein
MKKNHGIFYSIFFCLSLISTSIDSVILPSIGLGATLGTVINHTYFYAASSYLVQEKHLVATKYPYAQNWYDQLVIKYPTANLDKKLFLQTWRGVDSKFIQHCSSFHHIYFPQDSLEKINTLYKKVVDGEQLTTEEEISLGKEEFLLLHEAARIEHKDVASQCFASTGMLAGLTGLAALHGYIGTQKTCISFLTQLLTAVNPNFELDDRMFSAKGDTYLAFSSPRDWVLFGADFAKNSIFATSIHHYIAIIFGVILYGKMFETVAKNQEFAADKFACDLADINALEGGITFFEGKNIDPLIDIEQEKVSPFIPVQSYVGSSIQSWTQSQDEKDLLNLQNIKLNPGLRTQYDYERDPMHPSASSRAEKIREEIARRTE